MPFCVANCRTLVFRSPSDRSTTQHSNDVLRLVALLPLVGCRWDSLPLQSKVGVLTSLVHAICWQREVVAIFAPGISAGMLGPAAGTSSQAT